MPVFNNRLFHKHDKVYLIEELFRKVIIPAEDIGITTIRSPQFWRLFPYTRVLFKRVFATASRIFFSIWQTHITLCAGRNDNIQNKIAILNVPLHFYRPIRCFQASLRISQASTIIS